MSFDKLLRCPYEVNDEHIKCPEKDINIYILNQKDDNVVLHLTLTDARKVFEMNSDLVQQFDEITNDAFKNEISFNPGETIKRITEYDMKEDMNKIGRVDWMVFTYNLKNNDLVASLFYGDKPINEMMSLYIYAVFSNPKYRRQGHCENMIKSLRTEKSKIYDVFLMISTIFAWNVASMGLYRKMGFQVISVDIDDDIHEQMAKKGMTELKEVEFGDEKLTEGHYFTFIQHACSPNYMQNLIQQQMKEAEEAGIEIKKDEEISTNNS